MTVENSGRKSLLIRVERATQNGGDDLLQKYDYFSFLRKDFPLKVILSAWLKSLSKIDSV